MNKSQDRCKILYERMKTIPGSKQIILRSPLSRMYEDKADTHTSRVGRHESKVNSLIKRVSCASKVLYSSRVASRLGVSYQKKSSVFGDEEVAVERTPMDLKMNNSYISNSKNPFTKDNNL